jgi:serine/threonine protein kinase
VSILSLPVVVIVGSMALAIAGFYLAIKLAGVVFALAGRVLRFALNQVRDALLFAATVIRGVFILPRVLLSVVLGRWSAVRHHGHAVEVEMLRGGRLGYQLVIGNLLEALNFEAHVIVMDEDGGVIPDIPKPQPGQSPSDFLAGREPKPAAKVRAAAMRAAPGKDKPRKIDQFDGYRVVGSLPTGGSGARIFVADLEAEKRSLLVASGVDVPAQVVIKCFQLDAGSNLSQIVRESRALESAKRLGMVLEHGLDERRYFYVMPYVPGENLSLVSERMHAKSGAEGLGQKQIHESLGYMADLLVTLDRFHAAGLWHKDVKPDNIIVRDGRAHLVDLGLVTPLGSAMTLTTHGTEYFRDPELVRQALRGAKVHEVDGARFDLYAAGAVLFSLVENSFPAHGSLSSVSKRCPDGVQWIVRRAMADLDSRYRDAGEMLADVRKLQEASDPYAVRPAQLPSMGGKPPVDLLTPPPTQALPPLPAAVRAPQPAAAYTPPLIPGPSYQPGPDTGAFAEESVHRMPPPVPSKARAHALNAAREAKQALEAVRAAGWDTRDARKRARQKLAEARQKAAAVRADLGKRKDAFVAKLPKHTRDALASSAPKPSFLGCKERRAERRAARQERKARHSGGPTWGGWAAVAALLLIGTAGIALVSESRHSYSYQNEPAVAYSNEPGEFGDRVQVTSETISFGNRSVPAVVIRRDGKSVAIPSQSAHEGRTTGPHLLHSVQEDTAPFSGPTQQAAAIGANGDLDPSFPIARQKGRVLILDQYSELGTDQGQQIDDLRNQLATVGFGMVDSNYSGEGEVRVIEALAGARAAVGLYSPSDKDSRQQLLEYLAQMPGLDAIVWVAPDQKESSAQAFVAVQPHWSGDDLVRTLKDARELR